MAVEHEVKLAFASPEAARQAIAIAGGRLVRSRRLIEDRLFDDEDGSLRASGTALRVRQDGERAFVTWKGPTEPGPVKSRQELETGVGQAATLLGILDALGYVQRFRSQKYREEFDVMGGTVTVDETPCGVFVEIEGDPNLIPRVAESLGRTPSDYRLESYPTLWRQWCEQQGRPVTDMLFDEPTRS